MGMKSLTTYSFLLFMLGILGMSINSTNLMLLLMSVELMLLSTSLLFMAGSTFYDLILGQIFTMFMFTVAAAESAIGLAIMIAYFSLSGKMSVSLLNLLSG